MISDRRDGGDEEEEEEEPRNFKWIIDKNEWNIDDWCVDDNVLYRYTVYKIYIIYRTWNGALSWTTQMKRLTKLPPRVCFEFSMHITKFELLKFTSRYFIWFHFIFSFALSVLYTIYIRCTYSNVGKLCFFAHGLVYVSCLALYFSFTPHYISVLLHTWMQYLWS